MKWDEFQFVLQNKELFRYNDATMGGNDSSVDPTAATVDPSSFLAPNIGMRKIKHMLVLTLIILAIIYLLKHM